MIVSDVIFFYRLIYHHLRKTIIGRTATKTTTIKITKAREIMKAAITTTTKTTKAREIMKAAITTTITITTITTTTITTAKVMHQVMMKMMMSAQQAKVSTLVCIL
jgi:hypothetical protein